MPLFEDYPDYGSSDTSPGPKKRRTPVKEQLGIVSVPDMMFLRELEAEHPDNFELVSRAVSSGFTVTVETKDALWVKWVKHQLAERDRRIHALRKGMRTTSTPTEEHKVEGGYYRVPTMVGYFKGEWE